jgi:hypothetical protein
MFVYNPDNFNPAASLPPLLRRFSDCARLLVHIVLVRQCEQDLDEQGYVPLSAAILRKQVHPKFDKAIRVALRADGVLDCDDAYVPGVKCLGYRLGRGYRRRKAVRVRLHDKALLRRTAKEEGRGPVLLNEVHEMMWRWLNRVEIDYDGASRLLEKSGLALRNLAQKWITLEKLKAKELFFSSDPRGRVYHNIACLWKEFRPYLRLQGKRLANLDIANSQPLLFALSLRNYFQLVQEKNSSPLPSIYYSVAPNWRNGLYDDVRRYVELAEQGRLYEYLMDQFGLDRRKRDRFKRTLFANVFYSQLNAKRRFTAEFADLFPHVDEAIKHYKRHHHRDLPLRMHKAEADLILGTVCGRIVRDLPHAPFLTIHDSILTPPDHLPAIQLIMRDAFADVGLTPTFKATFY